MDGDDATASEWLGTMSLGMRTETFQHDKVSQLPIFVNQYTQQCLSGQVQGWMKGRDTTTIFLIAGCNTLDY